VRARLPVANQCCLALTLRGRLCCAGKTVELEGGGSLIGNVWGDSFASGILPSVREELNALHAAGEIQALVDTTASFAGIEAVPGAVEHMLSGASAGKVTVSFAPASSRPVDTEVLRGPSES
jgi:hypothetical protein